MQFTTGISIILVGNWEIGDSTYILMGAKLNFDKSFQHVNVNKNINAKNTLNLTVAM